MTLAAERRSNLMQFEWFVVNIAILWVGHITYLANGSTLKFGGLHIYKAIGTDVPLPNGRIQWLTKMADPKHLQLVLGWSSKWGATVDGSEILKQPPGMYKRPCKSWEKNYHPQLVQDFFR